MEILRKGQDATVLVEEALEGLVVVSLKVGGRTLRGVLLDADKRLATSEHDTSVTQTPNTDKSTSWQGSKSRSVSQQQYNRQLSSPTTSYQSLAQKRKHPQPVNRSTKDLRLKQKYAYVDSYTKSKNQERGPGFQQTARRSISPPRIIGATPRRVRPPKRARGKISSKSKEHSTVYSRHYQPLIHAGASSSLRTAMMGSLQLEKEMNTKPVDTSDATIDSRHDIRTNLKIQHAADVGNVKEMTVTSGFYPVSSDFTFCDGKLYTQVAQNSLSTESSSGFTPQQSWLKLEAMDTNEACSAQDQKQEGLSMAGTQPVSYDNSMILAATAQSAEFVSFQPEIRDRSESGCQETEEQTINRSPQPAAARVAIYERKGSSQQGEDEPKHLQLHTVGNEPRSSESVSGPPEHTAHRSIRLKIKRENGTSPVWVSESISPEFTTADDKQFPENATGSLEQTSRDPNDKTKYHMTLQSQSRNRSDVVDGHSGLLMPRDEKNSTPNGDDSTALSEAMLISKQEHKLITQTDKSRSSTGHSEKQPAATRTRRSDLFYAPRPSNKRSQPVNQESPPFNIYDIVWAKMVDRPWWPACILSFGQNEGLVTQTMLSASVKWLGRPTTCTAILPSSLLAPFMEGFVKHYDKSSTKSTYMRAIREALQLLGFNPDDPMAFYNHCKALFQTPDNAKKENGVNTDENVPVEPNVAMLQISCPDNPTLQTGN